jgi:hypothetical protein
MLREHKHQLADLPGNLSDLDLTPSGGWIGVTNLDDSQWVLFNGTSTPLAEECRFPKIRAIDDRTAILVNSRASNENNGWILDSSGKPKVRFYAGDAIQDVLASPEFIVITYFDESALTSPGIEGNGVAVFDVGGNFLFGYRDLFGDEAVDIADCYAACWAGNNRVLFFPYTDFPLVSLDLKNKTQVIWDTPDSVVGCGAISSLDGTVFFHRPYRDEGSIFEWKIGSQSAENIGFFSGSLRGLDDGKFLSVDPNGFVIVSPTEI